VYAKFNTLETSEKMPVVHATIAHIRDEKREDSNSKIPLGKMSRARLDADDGAFSTSMARHEYTVDVDSVLFKNASHLFLGPE
jgi:hypothetical protein